MKLAALIIPKGSSRNHSPWVKLPEVNSPQW